MLTKRRVKIFTGLIETAGTIQDVRTRGKNIEICVKAGVPDYTVAIGGSVAIDGVCLTLIKYDTDGQMFFTAVSETLKCTTLAKITAGRKVNLERAMRADGRFDGHIVLGHVDAVGKIIADENMGISIMRTIEVPENILPFMADKGSIAIDGISLTIAKTGVNTISLSLIPTTIQMTTMSTKKAGDYVNIEYDVLARYIHKILTAEVLSNIPAINKTVIGNSESLIDKMERLGF